MKGPHILYFVDGPAPSAAQLDEAAEINGIVQYRNVRAVDLSNPLEKADGVAGEVPDAYKHYPSPEEAVEKFKAEARKRRGAMGDKPAPGSNAEKLAKSDGETSQPGAGEPPSGGPATTPDADAAKGGDAPAGGAWGKPQ
ncbi:Phage DNA polymerase III subunits gamma and tau [Xanthomonas phage Suba]|uniref:Phage DNA polymerase III subunits gamma and tau n=1 Tax=Xanthomonas phage Suba TaxID=2674975 RepID=A0A679KD06_9CAUD|nr:Phage DNA polymerase III subunits gamma and tau [Xanthomonas phage Suba]CAA2409741.1 Phage DNA polymerase III subunits gamma and tau [Xanthomonas phage Suba]